MKWRSEENESETKVKQKLFRYVGASLDRNKEHLTFCIATDKGWANSLPQQATIFQFPDNTATVECPVAALSIA